MPRKSRVLEPEENTLLGAPRKCEIIRFNPSRFPFTGKFILPSVDAWDVVWCADYVSEDTLDEFLVKTDDPDITVATVEAGMKGVLKLDLMRLKRDRIDTFTEVATYHRFHTVAGLAEAVSISIVSTLNHNPIKHIDVEFPDVRPSSEAYKLYRTWGREDFGRAVCKECHQHFVKVSGFAITQLWHLRHSNLNKLGNVQVATAAKKKCCGG